MSKKQYKDRQNFAYKQYIFIIYDRFEKIIILYNYMKNKFG